MRPTLLVMSILGCAVMVFAADASSPEPKRLKTAKARHDKAVKQAETAFVKAELAAKSAYLRDVKAALTEATKAGQLGEANAIRAVQTEIEAGIEELELRLRGVEKFTLQVAANKDWQRAIAVRKGSTLVIRATGTWCNAVTDRAIATVDAAGSDKRVYDYYLPKAPYAALIGQIGEQRFVAGRSVKFRVPEDGDLEFRINDDGTQDNDGELTVSVYVQDK